MKIQSKKYSKIILTILLFALSMQSYAVFEGRNEDLQQYLEVRSQVEMPKATSNGYGGYDDNPENTNPDGYIGNTPMIDAPGLFLLLGLLYIGHLYFKGCIKIKHKYKT